MDIFAKKNYHQKGVQYLILGKERHLFHLFFPVFYYFRYFGICMAWVI